MTGPLAATAMAVMASVGVAPAAQATDFGTALNGTFRVKSDGQWARTNGVKIKQETVVETWKITTSCVSPIECSGVVTSDRGWTGTARLADYWFIEHVIDDWIPCSDGMFFSGLQKFILWGIDPATEERTYTDSDYWAGRNVTKGPSGACGVNNPVVIELPVSMVKIS
ncbi:MAG: hypothetical protein K0U76_05645 [Actinomycetia bacterium]|nr:hypothetical protein [Actinomycetes bacterium]MCH9700861.1 hypothetical protein [Actinomycetes bacterium]MCH9759563.1 hypothetical protein [Actinomycetes bacterium]